MTKKLTNAELQRQLTAALRREKKLLKRLDAFGKLAESTAVSAVLMAEMQAIEASVLNHVGSIDDGNRVRTAREITLSEGSVPKSVADWRSTWRGVLDSTKGLT